MIQRSADDFTNFIVENAQSFSDTFCCGYDWTDVAFGNKVVHIWYFNGEDTIRDTVKWSIFIRWYNSIEG